MRQVPHVDLTSLGPQPEEAARHDVYPVQHLLLHRPHRAFAKHGLRSIDDGEFLHIHAASLNFTKVTSSLMRSNTASTGLPIGISSSVPFARPTMLVMMRGPSSSSTMATLYGISGVKPEK